MNHKTLNLYKEENHPWPPFIPENATKLILGTFPTRKENRNTYNFFYPNISNRFWQILASITTDQSLQYFAGERAIAERKNILIKLKMGIADMGYRVLRQNNSSLDRHLFPIEFTDICAILSAYTSINKIIATSSSGPNSVYAWLNAYCLLNNICLYKPHEKSNPKYTSFSFSDRQVQVVVITSTSLTTQVKTELLNNMYRELFTEYKSTN